MRAQEIYNDGTRVWTFFGRDPAKPDNIVDTNQFLVTDQGAAMLLDPGGAQIFPEFAVALSRVIDVTKIESLFASHQDPDIISSLSLWLGLNPKLSCYASWTWASFIPHFGSQAEIRPLPDEGAVLPLGTSRDLVAVPAHYCHSSGNFGVYDPGARILFSGDLGAALQPDDSPIFVEDFDRHVQFMEGFHRRWLPSNRAKNAWVSRVRKLDLDMLCPQHGSIFRGQDIPRFLDWLEDLQVGSAV